MIRRARRTPQKNQTTVTQNPHRSQRIPNQTTDTVYGRIHFITRPTRRRYHPKPGQSTATISPRGPPTTATATTTSPSANHALCRKDKTYNNKTVEGTHQRPCPSPPPPHNPHHGCPPPHPPQQPSAQREPCPPPARQSARHRAREIQVASLLAPSPGFPSAAAAAAAVVVHCRGPGRWWWWRWRHTTR